MKRLLIILSAVVLSGCKESTTTTVTPLPSGTATLTWTESYLGGRSNGMGFKFATAKSILVSPDSSWFACDLITGPHTDSITHTAGAFLFRPGDTLATQGFCFVSKAADAQTAQSQFRSLLSAPDTGYQIAADPIEPNEVWVVQTLDRKFAKILIRTAATRTVSGVTPFDSMFTTATFDWVFQPSGSKRFEP